MESTLTRSFLPLAKSEMNSADSLQHTAAPHRHISGFCVTGMQASFPKCSAQNTSKVVAGVDRISAEAHCIEVTS